MWGSVAGLGLAWVWPAGLAPMALGLSVLGLFLCAPAQAAFAQEDPQVFVLDEVCGMLLSLVALPLTLPIVVSAFILFRVADSLKPWPIILFQRMKNPIGIMADDLAAGVLVNLFLQIIIRFVI